jgi:hypothetical protein
LGIAEEVASRTRHLLREPLDPAATSLKPRQTLQTSLTSQDGPYLRQVDQAKPLRVQIKIKPMM